MRIERHKNFLSLEECAELNAWADEGVQNKWLDVGTNYSESTYTKRLTSRMYAHRFDFPKFIWDISDRIRKYCGIKNYDVIRTIEGYAIVVSCTFSGGDVYPHKDMRQDTNAQLRCNVMTRAADDGGELYVGGEHIDIEVGELHCYLASEFEHKVTEVQGGTPRVLWMFGAAVPAKDWESGKIKVE
jgi:hypothetical protein